jgi:integrase
VVGAKRKDIGLGGYPDVSLLDAREGGRVAKAKIADGIDPVAEKRAARAALIAQQKSGMTFEMAVTDYLASNKLDALTNAKHRAQWEATLRTYAVPFLGHKRLSEITVRHVKEVLDPIWTTKHETAKRVRMRIEAVLTWATVGGHLVGANPARWKGNLSEMLPNFKASDVIENHPALPVDQVARWYAALGKKAGLAAKALSFLTLTASRSGEVRGALWPEINLEKEIWTVPGVRMKGGKEHRVALSGTAIDLLKGLPRFEGIDFVFPGAKAGKPMSDMTLSGVMRRMQADEIAAQRAGWFDPKLQKPAVPHGLRSTFKDWVGEQTDYPSDLAEVALAHKVGNAVEQAYRRGDMMEKRRKMMDDWADFVLAATKVAI